MYRAFAIAWALLFAVFVATHGKAYYLAPIYPVLLGLGACRIEAWLRPAWSRGAALTAVTAAGVLALPLSIPILPVETSIAYARAVGMAPSALAMEHAKLAALPQHLADMFGWREMAARIGAVYRGLPPQDRARAVFFGQNYGEAAAIDVFGAGLPPAISGHNNYFLWGPRGHDGSVIIVIGGNLAEMQGEFHSVTRAGTVEAAYAMPYETGKPIYVLRGAKIPLPAMWPDLKHYE